MGVNIHTLMMLAIVQSSAIQDLPLGRAVNAAQYFPTMDFMPLQCPLLGMGYAAKLAAVFSLTFFDSASVTLPSRENSFLCTLRAYSINHLAHTHHKPRTYLLQEIS
jgi:hypothetical protein